MTSHDSNMEQQLRSFATFEELDEFITANTIPEDLIPIALGHLVYLTAIAQEVRWFLLGPEEGQIEDSRLFFYFFPCRI